MRGASRKAPPLFFSKSEYLSARAMVTVPSVSCQLWCPKVSKGERREAGIQWIQPPKAVSDPEFRQTTSGAHGSANRADCLPRGKTPLNCARRRKTFLPGTTRRLRRGSRACSPMERSPLFFRWRKKSVQKKASGTATPGKSPLLPILAAGLAMSRAAELASYACYRVRSCSPFSAVKIGGPFSLRCLSPLCFAAGGMVQTYPLRVGRFVMTWIFLHCKRPA